MAPPAHFRFRLAAPAAPLPHVWEHTVGSCHAPLALRRLAGPAEAVPAGAGLPARALPRPARRRRRHPGPAPRPAHLLVLQRRPDRRFPAVDRHAAVRGAELHAGGPGLGRGHRLLLPGQRDAARRLPGVGRAGPPARGPLGGALRRRTRCAAGTSRCGTSPTCGRSGPARSRSISSCTATRPRPSRGSTRACASAGRPPPRTPGSRSSSTSASGTRLPADFVSTHHYPNDPLWSEAQDTESELAGGRRGILREWAAACRSAGARPAAALHRVERLVQPALPPPGRALRGGLRRQDRAGGRTGWSECYSFWTFTDLFEENYFPSVPFHGGFGLLNLHGVPKPVYRAFELLHRLGDERWPAEGRPRHGGCLGGPAAGRG